MSEIKHKHTLFLKISPHAIIKERIDQKFKKKCIFTLPQNKKKAMSYTKKKICQCIHNFKFNQKSMQTINSKAQKQNVLQGI